MNYLIHVMNRTAKIDYRGWPPLMMERDYVFPDEGFPLGVRIIGDQGPYCHHVHDNYSELVLVGAGTAIHEIDHLRYRIKAGDLFLIQGDRVHSYDDIDGLVLYNVLFDPSKLKLPWYDLVDSAAYQVLFRIDPASNAADRFENRFHLSAQDFRLIEERIKRLDELLWRRDDGHRFAAVGAFVELIHCIVEAYNRAFVDNVPHRLGVLAGRLGKHGGEVRSVGEMCRIAGMSQPTLFRQFKRAFGDSPLNYLLRQRVERAAELLVGHPEWSVAEIGVRSGFSDGAYFSRQFHRLKGCSPLQYRRRYGS